MSGVQDRIKKWPIATTKKTNNTFGSAEKLYATVHLIIRDKHRCRMMGVAGVEQRLKAAHAYQNMTRSMFDGEELNSKEVLEAMANDYLEDFVNYREQGFGMTNEEFAVTTKKIG